MKCRIMICDRIAAPHISAQTSEAPLGVGVRITEELVDALEQAAC